MDGPFAVDGADLAWPPRGRVPLPSHRGGAAFEASGEELLATYTAPDRLPRPTGALGARLILTSSRLIDLSVSWRHGEGRTSAEVDVPAAGTRTLGSGPLP